ncbi:MAG: GNAT family N-acetyltransferase, partial [Sulfitobacter geojensis]
MQFRAAEDGDTVALAHMWHKGWHEGHAAHVPAALVALRTVAEFEARTASHLAQTTVMEVDGQIAGFHMLEGDEIYQFYV